MDLGWKKLIPLSLGWLLIVAGFVVDGWWGLGMAAAVIAAAVVITRSLSIGAEREETRAIVPAVGVRLWTRPSETASSLAATAPSAMSPSDATAAGSERPVSPSTEGGGS
jgi:hypothetical protein